MNAPVLESDSDTDSNATIEYGEEDDIDSVIGEGKKEDSVIGEEKKEGGEKGEEEKKGDDEDIDSVIGEEEKGGDEDLESEKGKEKEEGVSYTVTILKPAYKLPSGWLVISKERKRGKTRGRVDKYWISPDGVKYNSLVRVKRAIKEGSP